MGVFRGKSRQGQEQISSFQNGRVGQAILRARLLEAVTCDILRREMIQREQNALLAQMNRAEITR